MNIPRVPSNISVKSTLTVKTNKSAVSVNQKQLKGLRDELFKLSVKGQQVNSQSQTRGKSSDIPKMEGLQIDKNDVGGTIPAIISDNQVIQGTNKKQEKYMQPMQLA